MREVWKTFRHGYYAVSNFGRVRRVKQGKNTVSGKEIKPSPYRGGYMKVCTSYHGRKKTYIVHILVARKFIGPVPEGKEVHHRDENKENNRWDNLKYITRLKHKEHHARLSKAKICEIRRLYSVGECSQEALGEKFGFHQSHISRIISKKVRRMAA